MAEPYAGKPSPDRVRLTWSPARPWVDLKSSELADISDQRRPLVGRSVRVNGVPLVIDSVSDIGDGWWRLRLTQPNDEDEC